jgi:hypothetical protein
MRNPSRRIGPLGTASRVIVAFALLYLALFDGASWGLEWYDASFGLAVLPGVMLVFGLLVRHYSNDPLRLTGGAGLTLNCAVLVALGVNPYTAGGAALFYGVTLVVAAWRAQPGCEATVLSNWILGRDDQVGCPVFSPLDEAERRLNARRHADGVNEREPLPQK